MNHQILKSHKAKNESIYAIIGGGPIGLFHALQLANKGLLVHVFEKKSWPVDKVCGQGLMPSGVKLLENVGVQFDKINSSEFIGIEYLDNQYQIEGTFEHSGRGMKRLELSQQLYELAERNNFIDLFANRSFNMNDRDQYKKIFVCDGLLSSTRRELGLTKFRKKDPRMGARFHVKSSHKFDRVKVLWKDGIEAYLTPTSGNEFEIAFLWFKEEHKISKNLKSFLLDKFPELEHYFLKSENDLKAYGPFNQYSSKIEFKNFIFLGDAFCFLDGITGEGMSIGFRASELIVNSLGQSLMLAKIKIKCIYLKYIIFAKLALCLSKFPKLRKLIFKFLSKKTRFFNLVLLANDY